MGAWGPWKLGSSAPSAWLSPAWVWLGPTFLLGSMGAVSTVPAASPMVHTGPIVGHTPAWLWGDRCPLQAAAGGSFPRWPQQLAAQHLQGVSRWVSQLLANATGSSLACPPPASHGIPSPAFLECLPAWGFPMSLQLLVSVLPSLAVCGLWLSSAAAPAAVLRLHLPFGCPVPQQQEY